MSTHGAGIADSFDLATLTPDFFANPYPNYRALREHAPVKAMPDGSWFLTRYDDILPVYRDPKVFSSDKKKEFGPKYGPSPLLEHHTTSLVFNDPPLHTRVRRLILGALSQRHIAAMEPGLQTLVDALLDGDGATRARSISSRISRRRSRSRSSATCWACRTRSAGRCAAWSLAILGALEPVLTPERAASGNAAVREMVAYLGALASDRRLHPRDPETDVLTRLIQGEHGNANEVERLTETELMHQCIFLLNAGHETTTNLIGNALHALTEWPDEKARLIANARRSGHRQVGGRGIPALREFEPAGQPDHDLRHHGRRRQASARCAHHDVHRRRQSRSGAVPRSGPSRHHARAEQAHRIRLRHSYVRRDESRATRGARGAGRFPRALSRLHAGRRTDARRSRALSRLPASALPRSRPDARGCRSFSSPTTSAAASRHRCRGISSIA